MTTWVAVEDVLLRYVLAASVAAAVLPAAAWLLIKCARMRPAVHRHMVWFWCLIMVAVLPVLWLYAPKMAVTVVPARAARVVSVASQRLALVPSLVTGSQGPRVLHAGPTYVASPRTDLPAPKTRVPWRTVLIGVWMAGAAAMLGRLVLGMRQLSRIVAGAETLPETQDSPATHGQARVLLSDAVTGPVCFGLLRPTILLPRRMYPGSSKAELRMILRHELAHVQRRDAWANLLQRLLESVLFFHPGLWLASRQLTQQREIICDNWVLADGVAPDVYAHVLARVAEATLTPRPAAAALSEGHLLQRIRSVLDPWGLRPSRLSRTGMLIGTVLGLLILGGLGVVRLQAAASPQAATAVIRVVDDQGRPVAGAKIVPRGIRALPMVASAYRWDSHEFSYGVPPEPVTTDATGQAQLPYPRQIRFPYEGAETDMQTRALILAVYHPEYSPTVEQNYQTSGRQEPLVMHPGARLKLSGYIASPEQPVAGVLPRISNWNISLKEVMQIDNGVCTINGLPVGPHYIRLVYWPEKGTPRFSDPVRLEAQAGQTYALNLELKPAMRVEGQLDSSVPRPVRNGYVQVHVSYPTQPHSDAGYDYWNDWSRIAEDGTFHIDAMPQGALQAVGVCDGYTWKAPGLDTEPGYGPSALAQTFTPQGDAAHIVLTMQPAATYEVHVVDPDGQPIEGAQVRFTALGRWFSSRMQVVEPLRRTSDLVLAMRRGQNPSRDWVHYYEAVTDSRGGAVVHNLPASGLPIGPRVEHVAYPRGSWSPRLTEEDLIPEPGEVKKLTVTMTPRPAETQAARVTADVDNVITAISQNEQPLQHIYVQSTYKSEFWDAEKNDWTDGGDGKIKSWHMGRPGSKMKLDMEQRTRWIDGPSPFSEESLMEAYNGRARKILFRKSGNPAAPDIALRGQVEANRSDGYDAFICGWRCSLFGIEDRGRRGMRVSEYFTKVKEIPQAKLSASYMGDRDQLVEVVCQQPGGGKEVYHFDSSRGYALMHKSSWTADGTKTFEMSIEELDEPLPGVFYPRRAWRRGFSKDGTPRHRTEYVAEEIVANDSSTTDDTYDFNWPAGTTVHDKISNTVFRIGVGPAGLIEVIDDQVEVIQKASSGNNAASAPASASFNGRPLLAEVAVTTGVTTHYAILPPVPGP